MTTCTNPPTLLQAVVFHGQHKHVDGYAKDSAMTVIIQPSVLNCDSTTGSDGRLIITWDKNAAGVRNATGQEKAIINRQGETLLVMGNDYWLKGDLHGELYYGQYYNRKNELCGSFSLTSKV